MERHLARVRRAPSSRSGPWRWVDPRGGRWRFLGGLARHEALRVTEMCLVEDPPTDEGSFLPRLPVVHRTRADRRDRSQWLAARDYDRGGGV